MLQTCAIAFRYGVLESSIKNSTQTGIRTVTTTTDPSATRVRRHNSTVKESTIIKSLLVVVLVFLICMSPFSVTKLIKVRAHCRIWFGSDARLLYLVGLRIRVPEHSSTISMTKLKAKTDLKEEKNKN